MVFLQNWVLSEFKFTVPPFSFSQGSFAIGGEEKAPTNSFSGEIVKVSVRFFRASVIFFKPSVRLFGTSVTVFKISVRTFRASVRLFDSSVRVFKASVRVFIFSVADGRVKKCAGRWF